MTSTEKKECKILLESLGEDVAEPLHRGWEHLSVTNKATLLLHVRGIRLIEPVPSYRSESKSHLRKFGSLNKECLVSCEKVGGRGVDTCYSSHAEFVQFSVSRGVVQYHDAKVVRDW
jgi:hypothetical protein